MAVRRHDAYSGPGRHSLERLLAWNCRWLEVPDEFLEHQDPEVRRLAELTQETAAAALTNLWQGIRDDEAGRPIDYRAEERARAEIWRRYAVLATARRDFAEARGLRWRHPYRHAGFARYPDDAA